MSMHDLLQLPETLLWAWRKVKRCYQSADSLYDQAELAAFGLNLEAELEAIRADFAVGRWATQPLRLVPQPKKPKKDGHPRLRQYFEVAVRDQVAWTAIATVLGPELDRRMPAWSYGNRLYRAAWYEEETPEGRTSKLNIGPYRHASGHLYRHFKHSWPLYRRHISLTARKMVGKIDHAEIDEGDRRALDQDDGLAYLDGQHWPGPKAKSDIIYAVSFDLMKFYPSIRIAAVLHGFETFLDGFGDERLLQPLLEQMLHFEVDESGLSEEMRAAVEPLVAPGPIGGIPTGLFVGGFLANVAMLPIDRKIDEKLLLKHDIAHFRFVDDHEVLAYDFATALDWIRDYRRLLDESGIGVEIEPDKYTPFELKWLIHPELLDDPDQGDRPTERGDALILRVAKTAQVNGRKPTELMTRTLAQVSMLAATDFDLLTDAGRSQRLEQLEWLLLANIPDQEIRGDTRMAFAAAKIAALTPALFKPNEELLKAHRQIQVLLIKQRNAERQGKVPSEEIIAAITALRDRIGKLEGNERKDWDDLRKRHFGLLFEAFITHPDKARLFIRLIDYCRTTGHNGFERITEWMEQHDADESQLLQRYLGAMALQVLSRHILAASVALGRSDLLHRERACARGFLEHLVRAKLHHFVPFSSQASAKLQRFQSDAKRALTAALLLGAFEVERVALTPAPELATAMRARAEEALGTFPSLENLHEATGISTGIWYHWFMSTTRAWPINPPPYWAEIEAAHDVEDSADWISLRRYPAQFPKRGWDRLGTSLNLLAPDDAGWLIETARADPERFAALSADLPVVASVRNRIETADLGMSLLDWIAFTETLRPADPRRSEWTALEIVRQILESVVDIDGPNIDVLDRLHPENVLIDPAWKDLDPKALINDRITWESWRKLARAQDHKIRLAGAEIEDYRYREQLLENDRRWPLRLRPIGQLLWGILRRSFQLPSDWNIRGQERGLIEAVAWDLERLPISSLTLSILQSCLLPRSGETALLVRYPALFGNRLRVADNDTEFDRRIEGPDAFIAAIDAAQIILVLNQMTVLEYQPRQLIPVRLRHISQLDDGAAQVQEELQ